MPPLVGGPRICCLQASWRALRWRDGRCRSLLTSARRAASFAWCSCCPPRRRPWWCHAQSPRHLRQRQYGPLRRCRQRMSLLSCRPRLLRRHVAAPAVAVAALSASAGTSTSGGAPAPAGSMGGARRGLGALTLAPLAPLARARARARPWATAQAGPAAPTAAAAPRAAALRSGPVAGGHRHPVAGRRRHLVAPCPPAPRPRSRRRMASHQGRECPTRYL